MCRAAISMPFLHLLFLGHAAHFLEQGVGHEDARDGAVHVLGHAHAGEHHEPAIILTLVPA